MPGQADSATNNGQMGILARSPAGFAFGLLSLVPANDLRLIDVGSGEVGGTPATTYLFGYSGHCQGTVQTKVWTTAQGRILQLTTTQSGSRGKQLERMSLTFTQFGLPVAILPPPSSFANVVNGAQATHVAGAGSTGTVEARPMCST
jgi:hypothetical protein